MSDQLQTRHLDVAFHLGKGSFGDSGADSYTATGCRTSATITKAGGVSKAELSLRIMGLPLEIMNKLATLGKPLVEGRNNTIDITAHSDGGNKIQAFTGTIFQAWTDLQSAPDAVFTVSAFTGLLTALQPVPPTSYTDTTDVAAAMQQLAGQMGLAFENSGVDVQLTSPYLPGTAWEQASALAEAAGINWTIEDDKTLAIWPMGGSRTGAPIEISAATRMIGYPTWTDNGIVLRTLYEPNGNRIVFGRQLKVTSIIQPAVGSWTAFSVQHRLEAEMPGGAWETKVEASVLGHAAIPTA
jgi:hypothetical protein